MGGFLSRLYKSQYPSQVKKTEKPIRIGILGAARIAPLALIRPALYHPDVIVAAIAARDKSRAEEFAKKWKIKKVYGGSTGYQDMLNDPEIDAIYNPLPNGLHFEWSMKALAAGKHVLLEKPSTNTADEARRLWNFAKEKNLVLLEAFHYRFHPAVNRVKEIIDSGDLGKVKHLNACLAFSAASFIKDGDIRLQYPLGGGAMMDMGAYPLSAVRFLTSSNPTSVSSAKVDIYPKDSKVDSATKAELVFPDDITASIRCNFFEPKKLGFIPGFNLSVEVELEGGKIRLSNFVMPTAWHTITVEKKGKDGKVVTKRKEKVYTYKNGEVKGEPYWTTYRFMLEAFVDKLRGRTPRNWVTPEDSVAEMEAVDMIYEKSGLGLRPNSTFAVTS